MGRSTSKRRLRAEREQVLIVDDETLVAEAIAGVLDDYDTTHVASADEALELLGSGREFDVVLCDIGLQGMSGIDLYGVVCRHLPELSQRFAFMTGGALTPEADVFVRAHADRIIDKPFDLGQLRHTIATVSGAGPVRVREKVVSWPRRP